MIRYYMSDTPLAGYERPMMLPPNFRPRGGGMLVDHKYTAADCDCRYCLMAENNKQPCKGAGNCVCFEERLTAGCWTHGELAESKRSP